MSTNSIIGGKRDLFSKISFLKRVRQKGKNSEYTFDVKKKEFE